MNRNKQIYIGVICLVTVIIVFIIGFSIGSITYNKSSKVNESEIKRNDEGYWVKSVNGSIIVYAADEKTIVTTTDISVDVLNKSEKDIIETGIHFSNAEELFNFLEANTS